MIRKAFAALTLIAAPVLTQAPAAPVTRNQTSAPITDVRYEVTFNRETASTRMAHVTRTFGAAGQEPILLSLPAWTPGAYEISNFARWVVGFAAEESGKSLQWDKLDFDTWRVRR